MLLDVALLVLQVLVWVHEDLSKLLVVIYKTLPIRTLWLVDSCRTEPFQHLVIICLMLRLKSANCAHQNLAGWDRLSKLRQTIHITASLGDLKGSKMFINAPTLQYTESQLKFDELLMLTCVVQVKLSISSRKIEKIFASLLSKSGLVNQEAHGV